MATLGTMRTRIADELKIDATTFSTQIDRAIYSAIKHHESEDWWFLEASPTTFQASATSVYVLGTILPDRTQIRFLTLHLSGSQVPMHYQTPLEMNDNRGDVTPTGEPLYWTVDHERLTIYPTPVTTRTVEVMYSLRVSMTSSASASSVWTNEAEEVIRCRAKIDILENQMKDYDESRMQRLRLLEALENLRERSTVMKSVRRIKPFM